MQKFGHESRNFANAQDIIAQRRGRYTLGVIEYSKTRSDNSAAGVSKKFEVKSASFSWAKKAWMVAV